MHGSTARFESFCKGPALHPNASLSKASGGVRVKKWKIREAISDT